MELLFGCGILGGLFTELLGLFKLRQQAPAQIPAYLRSIFYWVVTIAMIIAGGGLVLIYSAAGIDLNPLVAVNIGASAPLIIGSLASQVPVEVRVN